MQCDMCGKEAPLFLAEVEMTKMSVCKGCSSYGKILRAPQRPRQSMKKSIVKEEAPIPLIIGDYGQRIKQAREKRGLTQELLGKKMGEKESLIHKMESNHFEPSIALAKKLERFLDIQLIDASTEKIAVPTQARKSEGLTIGDLLKKSKKNKKDTLNI